MRPDNEALLVIDVQNDFCLGGALEVPDADAIIPRINTLIGMYATRVFTQDWHPAGHSSFASYHSDKQPLESVEMPYGPQTLWPDHCMQGTVGADFHRDLLTDAANAIIRKGTNPLIDSYSAFFENDRTTPTGLAGYLKTRGVTTVRMAGLATDFCVFYSAMDAANLGLRVEVERAACRGINVNGSLAEAERAMREKGVKLV